MKTEQAKDIDRLFREGTPIDDALKAATREAYRKHKQAGLPVLVWKDGQGVWLPPEQIACEE